MSTLDFYMARAEECRRDAEASTLVNVRERLFNAQEAWLQMAARIERTNGERAVLAAHKAELAAQADAVLIAEPAE